MKMDSHNEEEQLFTKTEVMDLVRQIIKDELTVETDYDFGMDGSTRVELTLKLGDEIISDASFRVEG